MPKGTPDHHDAELALRVYDMRREAVMRESRAAINQKFWPKTFDDMVALTKADHPLNAAYRQVGSFWEMVYGFARHGIVHPDFWLESNGEGMYVFAKVAPFSSASAPSLARGLSQRGVDLEGVARGPRLFAMFCERVKRRSPRVTRPSGRGGRSRAAQPRRGPGGP